MVLDNNLKVPSYPTHQETPLDVVTVQSGPSSSDLYSSSPTDESWRNAIDNYDDEKMDLDSELFNAEHENFINCYKMY